MRASFRLASRLTSFALLLLAGCMVSPRNGDELPTRWSDVTFQGFVPVQRLPVKVAAYNYDYKQWDTVQTYTSGTNAIHDEAGQDWFEWKGTAKLPQGSQYWMQDDSGERIVAQVKSYIGDDIGLAGFDTSGPHDGANQCMADHAGGGGVEIINSCKSELSPSVLVSAPCGDAGEACCDQPQCKPGLGCNGSGRCETCGGNGQVCCAKGCNSGLYCGPDARCGTVPNPGYKPQVWFEPDPNQCWFVETDTNCYGVVQTCTHVWHCGHDNNLNPIVRKDAEEVCGVCIGFDW